MKTPPAAALVLGFAGLLPPLGTIAAEWFMPGHLSTYAAPLVTAAMADSGLTYIALILSFLGGIWWGASVGKVSAGQLWGWLVLAVVPTLVAAVGLTGAWTDPATRAHAVASLLLVALLLSLIGDWLLARAGLVPAWWMRLRVPLSVLLAVETGVIAALA